MQLIIIAATSKNHIIGNKGKIPWHLPSDFKRFKELTMGHPCIMGDVTYNSLPFKSRPLPGRENIILTKDRSINLNDDNIKTFNFFHKALEYLENKKCEKAYIIGGGSVYKTSIAFADKLEITRINKDFEGDVLFPQIPQNSWRLDNKEDFIEKDKLTGEDLEISYETYTRTSLLTENEKGLLLTEVNRFGIYG